MHPEFSNILDTVCLQLKSRGNLTYLTGKRTSVMYSRGCSLREVVLSRAKKIRLAMWKPQRQQLKKLTRTVRTNASSTEFRKGKHVSNQSHQRQPLFDVSICFPLGLSFSNQELSVWSWIVFFFSAPKILLVRSTCLFSMTALHSTGQ